MDLIISTQPDSPPIYKQLYDSISAQIFSGQLESGTALPPIRTVAKELRISVVPVKMAWEELERAGLIYTMVGRGCFVAQIENDKLGEKRDTMAYDKLMREIEYYKSLGFTKKELLDMVERCFEDDKK